jgi:hypothetical protein
MNISELRREWAAGTNVITLHAGYLSPPPGVDRMRHRPKRGAPASRGAATDKKPRQQKSAQEPLVMIDPVLRKQNFFVRFR